MATEVYGLMDLAFLVLASIPGRTSSEDGPGINCLRMRHVFPETGYFGLCSAKQ